jgi:Tfp pilus assembly protein PilO
MADLMRIVSNEAKSAGSSLATIQPKTTEVSAVAPEFEELTVELELQGSFLQHMVFLANLTKVQQILIVRKFEFSHLREGKGDEAPQVKLVAEIVAYRYRGKAAAKPAEGGADAGAGAAAPAPEGAGG